MAVIRSDDRERTHPRYLQPAAAVKEPSLFGEIMPPTISGQLWSDVRKLWKDVYEGEGQNDLSVITRLTVLEENMDDVKKAVDKNNKALNRLFWISLGTLVTIIADLIVKGH
jgi:hypothetical protein